MAENNRWSRKVFAILLEKAKGDRSWRQFSFDCGISYVQMRKLADGTQVNPPRPKLIQKVAAQAFGEIDLEDLMFAAGMNTASAKNLRDGEGKSSAYEKYRALPPKNRKLVDKFIEFLMEDSKSKG